MLTSERNAMTSMDDNHWWYRGRRKIVLGFAERLRLGPGSRVLDAGCGSGRTLIELARFGSVCGFDLDPATVALARQRSGADVRQADVAHLPWPAAVFDLVTCLDVVEHLDDDVEALSELLRVTRPGGVLLLTVPAYQSLWSYHDVVNGHRRRYRARALRSAVRAAGWHVEDLTYFNSLLLPPAAIARWARRGTDASAERSDLELTPPGLNRALALPLHLEAAALGLGVRLPAGLSLLCVCRRPLVAAEEVTPAWAAPAAA
jgi:SAM-dependent methyltransferase